MIVGTCTSKEYRTCYIMNAIVIHYDVIVIQAVYYSICALLTLCSNIGTFLVGITL